MSNDVVTRISLPLSVHFSLVSVHACRGLVTPPSSFCALISHDMVRSLSFDLKVSVAMLACVWSRFVTLHMTG